MGIGELRKSALSVDHFMTVPDFCCPYPCKYWEHLGGAPSHKSQGRKRNVAAHYAIVMERQASAAWPPDHALLMMTRS